MVYQIINVEEKEGFLELKVLPGEKEELEDVIESLNRRKGGNRDIELLSELLEPFWSNGRYYLIAPETIGALTDAPIIASEMYIEDDGSCTFPEDVKIWWYPQYETTFVGDELLEKGFVRFVLARKEKSE